MGEEGRGRVRVRRALVGPWEAIVRWRGGRREGGRVLGGGGRDVMMGEGGRGEREME
jgi:hypothetical protein